MKKYKVKFYRGDYKERQSLANADSAICYIEAHFNSTSRKIQTTADYAVCIIGRNASTTSIRWAKKYSRLIKSSFHEIKRLGGIDGVMLGGYGGRGDSNIIRTKMPAILTEPMFCNDPEHAEVIKSKNGQMRLANILADTIVSVFKKGGLCAFSVGHKYKTSRPNDRGATIYGGGWEADYAEKVLVFAKKILESKK